MSFSNYAEDAIIDALFNNTALQKANRYAKLHIGNPGEACTANAATETTRKSITGAAASGGTFTSTNDLVWASLPADETFTHVSIWDHVSAGNALIYGALSTPISKLTGETLTIAAGDLFVTVS